MQAFVDSYRTNNAYSWQRCFWSKCWDLFKSFEHILWEVHSSGAGNPCEENGLSHEVCEEHGLSHSRSKSRSQHPPKAVLEFAAACNKGTKTLKPFRTITGVTHAHWLHSTKSVVYCCLLVATVRSRRQILSAATYFYHLSTASMNGFPQHKWISGSSHNFCSP